MNIIEIVGLMVLWAGLGFCAVGVLGIIRMPDLYCRLHASGKVATVGLCGLLVGASILMPALALKALALGVFAVLTLPVSTHAIAAAAYRHGIPMDTTAVGQLKPRTVELLDAEEEAMVA